MRTGWRYAMTCAGVAPAAVLIGVGALSLYFRPTMESTTASNRLLAWLTAAAMLLVVSAILAAGTAAVAYAVFKREPFQSMNVWMATVVLGAAGAVTGVIVSIAVFGVLGGWSMLRDPFFLALYLPGAFAGACCGMLLPQFSL